jgi:hypothetical protein
MVVAVVPTKGLAGLFVVDSVNGDDLGIVPLDQAARTVRDSGESFAHCSISTDVFAVYSSSSTIL